MATPPWSLLNPNHSRSVAPRKGAQMMPARASPLKPGFEASLRKRSINGEGMMSAACVLGS